MNFTHLGSAEYNFCGKVIRLYRGKMKRKLFGIYIPFFETTRPNLIIVDTGEFRFYIENPHLNRVSEGMLVSGRGTLLLDYYIWTETLHKRQNPPDIFYRLEVSRIRKVQIPERFITRHDRGKAYPTRVSPADSEDISELETMEGQKFDEEFYLIDFKETIRKDAPDAVEPG